MKPAIRVENLSKSYRLGTHTVGGYRTLREAIGDSAAAVWKAMRRRFASNGNGTASDRAKDNIFWALEDVSFEVQPGEVVGIIGRNGAGKSTLLKVLSRIVEPTQGRCEIRGRVASLLEVATGFHPELTGRENIYMNGSILGMTRKELNKRFDQIVAFSGIEKMLDTPVKRYSSGMYVRLAFSVAAHVDPEILVIDEVLAVGDANFQAKCLRKLDSLRNSGMTIILVSHHMPTVRRACQRVMVLEKGALVHNGDPVTAVAQYQTMTSEAPPRDTTEVKVSEDSPIRITHLTWEGKDGEGGVQAGGEIVFHLHYEAKEYVPNPTFNISLKSPDERVYTGWHSAYDGFSFGDIGPGRGTVSLRVPYMGLEPGLYNVSLGIWSNDGFAAYDWLWDHYQLTIVGEKRFLGQFELPHQWSLAPI